MRENIENAIANIDEKYITEALDRMDIKPAQHKARRIVLKTAAIAAAVLIIFFGSLTVAVGAGSLPAYKLMRSIDPAVAEKLTPVNESCVDNGICMTVEGINVDGGSAEICVSLTDLEGDRIDETTDLFDSYSIRSTAEGAYGCAFLDFDQETKTATYMIYIDQDTPINGDKLNFSVSQLLTGKKDGHYRLSEIGSDIPTVQPTKTAGTVNTRGSSLGEKYSDWDWDEWDWYEKEVKLLDPDPEQSFSPTDGVIITAWGWVDGHLHVQALYDDIFHLDNHGYVYFESDETLNPDFDISFWDEEQVNSYEEYVFEDIMPQDLESGSFWGRFVTTPPDGHIRGDWHVSCVIK